MNKTRAGCSMCRHYNMGNCENTKSVAQNNYDYHEDIVNFEKANGKVKYL